MSMEQNPSLNFIDLFAGAGGLSCGLEMAGLTCLLGVDDNLHAIKTFAHNHQFAATFCGDIRQLDRKQLFSLLQNRPIHAVVGGPPCQGFSTVGLGNPKDERNHLFLEFCRIVKLTQPYFLIMENVTGLLAKKNEKTLKAIFMKLGELGYNLNVQVLHAEQYGVPEKRRRTIILGSRINAEVNFPLPTHDIMLNGQYVPPVTVGEVFANLHTIDGQIFNHDLESAQIPTKIDEQRLKRIPEGKGIRYEQDEKMYLTPKMRLGVRWEKLPERRFRQMKYQRLSRFAPSPTIMTHRHTYYHPTECRYLTPREAAAIQSFPNHFFFAGPLSSQWRQIGNAVPPLLGKALGNHLWKLFQDANLSKNEKRDTRNWQKSLLHMRKKAFVYRERGEEISAKL